MANLLQSFTQAVQGGEGRGEESRERRGGWPVFKQSCKKRSKFLIQYYTLTHSVTITYNTINTVQKIQCDHMQRNTTQYNANAMKCNCNAIQWNTVQWNTIRYDRLNELMIFVLVILGYGYNEQK